MSDKVYFIKVYRAGGSTFYLGPERNGKIMTEDEAQAMCVSVQESYDAVDQMAGREPSHQFELFPVSKKHYMIYKLRGVA